MTTHFDIIGITEERWNNVSNTGSNISPHESHKIVVIVGPSTTATRKVTVVIIQATGRLTRQFCRRWLLLFLLVVLHLQSTEVTVVLQYTERTFLTASAFVESTRDT